MGTLRKKRIGYQSATEATLRMFYALYRDTSRHRKRAFNLSYRKFKSLILLPCYYCGALPNNSINAYLRKDGNLRRTGTKVTPARAEQATIKVNGLDRVNNKYGYNEKNVVPCCTHCNRAKSNVSILTFLTWLDQLVQYRYEQRQIQNPDKQTRHRRDLGLLEATPYHGPRVPADG